jgi:hypothetical protein
MSLPRAWIDRIFLRLIGIYGAQFKAKFSVIENGIDIGMENAKEVWADELASFHDLPDAIAYALKNLPTDRAPNALEFREICRRAPRKEPLALPHHLSPEEIKRNKQRIAEMVGTLAKSKTIGGE